MNFSNVPQQEQVAVSARRLILIVEDEFLIRVMLSDQLRERGFDVVEAFNADEALTILSVSVPRLIVTDVRMPGKLNGIDLLSKVRATNPELPVVVVSGHLPGIEITDRHTQFMAKPYSIDALLQKIEAALTTT